MARAKKPRLSDWLPNPSDTTPISGIGRGDDLKQVYNPQSGVSIIPDSVLKAFHIYYYPQDSVLEVFHIYYYRQDSVLSLSHNSFLSPNPVLNTLHICFFILAALR